LVPNDFPPSILLLFHIPFAIGVALPDWLELEHILRAVNDVLWICKLYAGEEWAGSYVSGDTTSVWPASE
jgi:hypothetical protein